MKSSTNRALVAKKQSTSFTQVATNLLNVLQGYTKTIRLLLVMFLTLTVTTNAWADSTPGTGYTLVTDISSLSTNDKVILFCNQNGEGVSGYNGSKDANVSTTAANWIEYLVTKSTNSFTLKDGDKYIANPGGNEFKYGGSGGACTLGSDGLLICNSRNLMKNGNNYRFYATTQSYTNRFYVYKVAVSYAITAQSNNTTYGTVSLSGTTITATPKTGYRVSTTNPYTISPSNSAKVTQNGNTFTVTPSANTTITIYFEAIPKYTVTLNAGPGTCAASVTEASAGAGVTLPTPTLNGCGEWTFAGWKTTSAVTTETTTEPTLIPAGAYSPTSDITLYAVYQRTETTSGGGGGGVATVVDNLTHSINGQKSSNTSYVEFSDKTYTSEAKYAGSTSNGNNNTITGVIQIRSSSSNTGIITTASGGKVKKVIVVWDSGTTSGRTLDVYGKNSPYDAVGNLYASDAATKGTKLGSIVCGTSTELNITEDYEYIGLRSASNAMYLTSIAITWESTTGGSSSTTYYHSTPDCGSTEPSQLATPTGLNVTNITSTSATLSWGEVANASSYLVTIVDGGDLSADIPNTQTSHTFEGLTPSTEYLWTVKAIGDGITYTNSEESETGEFTTSPATCTVTYDANGGEGTIIDNTEYTNGATVTVLGNFGKLTKDGYAFTGWTDGSGNSYKHNDKFTITTNTTLYAQWCKAYWKLVTDAAELENDTRIVIAAKDYNFALSTTQATSNRGQAEITKKYNTITFGADVQTLSAVGPVNNNFALYSPGPLSIGYLYAASNSANQLKTKTTLDNNCYWSIGISETVASIYAQGDNSHNQIKYNHQQSGQLFSCYESSNTTMSAVAIYKEVCVQDQYNVNEPNLTNTTAANNNPTTVDADAPSLTLNYSANTGYLLPETITVKMGGVELLSGTDYNWNKGTGELAITVTGFYGDIDVKIVAEADPCYQFEMSEVTATSTTPNSVTLTWTQVTGATGYNVKLGTGEFTEATGLTHTFEELTPKTTYNWEVQAVKDGADFHCEASKTGSTTTQKETFTVSWMVNGQEYHTQSALDGTTLEIPTIAPDPETYACDDKVFVGWTEDEIIGSSDDAPADLFTTLSATLTENKTYYAVFADESIIDTGSDETTIIWNETFGDAGTSNIDWSDSYTGFTGKSAGITYTKSSNPTIKISKNTTGKTSSAIYTATNGTVVGTFTVSGLNTSGYTNLQLVYNVKLGGGDSKVGKVTINSTDYAAASLSTGTWNEITCTNIPSQENLSITFSFGSNGTNYLDDITLTGQQSSSVTYTEYVTTCAIIPDPVWGGAEISNATIAVECGTTSSMNSAATITFPAETNNTLTYDITVTASTGFLVSTNKTYNAGYGESVTVSPVKTGTNAGTITQNIYVRAVAPATSDDDFVGTITISGKQLAENQVINVTADVTCQQYTLTFNDRGNTTTQEYYAGAEVPQPEDPTGVCTIPVNYVFDGWAEAEVTDGSTSYTKVNFPYSMPAANTTLYAVYRYTEENANSDKFMSVDKVLGELVSGMDYVLTGYYDDDNYDEEPGKEYAMSITAYETGKYKTKYVDVQESSILYEEDIPYYEFTTTDNEIIWTIEGDEDNGYTFQNKSNNKYLAVSDDKLTLSDNAAKFTIEHETGVENDEEVYYMSLLIQPVGSTNYLSSYYKNATAGVLFNLHTASTLSLYLYKRVASNLYTTSPDCGGIAITYDFAGGDGGHCTDTRVEGGSDYTICEDVPTKTGYTFLHWSDGANTYNPSDVIVNVTADVTLTAIWQINTYTVTWSNNGASTPVEYNHGDALEVPAAPASCDGVKEFVGWTEQSGYYHATTPPSDLFTEKTATVTADATYYAVFATQGEGSANFVLGESGTFKMYANVNGTNYYAQGGVSSKKITSTTEAANASDYTLTHKGSNQYTIQLGNAYIGHSGTSSTDLNTTETTWTIQEGVNGSWRIVSPVNTSRALAYRASTYKIFKAYSMTSVEAGDTEYYDIEFGGTSSGYSDYTTTCQQIESIEVQSPQTEFYLTDDFTIGTGKVIATLSGSGTTDVTALATFSGYNMNQVGTYTVTVTYMGATATYEINVKPLDNAWVLTWNVSGKTNTGLSPRSVTKGNAIGTLPVPEVPAACEGKTFMGWTESNIVPSDGKGIVYITEETKPTDNTTYYAVFATVNNFSVQKPIEEIKSGSKVVVVAVASLTADGGSGKAISSRTISITSQGVIGLSGDEVSISDETINTPHSTCIWTLTKEGGGIVLEQDGNYIRAVDDGYRKLLLETTKDYWTLTPVEGKYQTYHMQSGNTEHYLEWFDHTDDKYDEGEKYIGFVPFIQANDYGDFDMQFFVTLGDNADITDYTTGCEEYTITYYGFRGGYSTSTSSDGIIVLPVNSLHTVPDCGDVVTDHTNLGREFLNVWMTQPHGGHTFKPGDTFILTQDTTLYAQWKLETTSDVTTLPTDIEDMAGTDIYVYGGKTLNIQPGTTTINSLTLKGGLQSDGSYKMPIVWVPEGATLVRNSNKIYLDLAINAKNYYPFAVPFATKNDQYIDYLDPVLREASTYGTHFAIKTYDGARRATQGEDRANNWKQLLRHTGGTTSYLEPGVGYIITALTYPDKDTATIRIPMTVPNTWFENGEQAVVGTTVRNTIAVTAHDGDAANEHLRHAGWNFVASPYLTNFAGGNVENNGGLEYINGELTVNGGWLYGGDPVPYVTIPAYDFAYYSQHKLSDVKLSPEWSFFVQIGTSGTMNFSTDGRQEIPASIAARHDAAQSFKMDVDITLSDKHHSDQMGLIICDRFTSAYEIGYDLEKMFGSAYNLTVYTLMEDNTPLAYHALAIHSNMQVIPVGYRVPEQGDYTFALNQSTSSIDLLNEQYEQLILVDYETGALTNLLNSSYTFTSPRTQSNSRFAIYAVMRQDIPTDLPNIDDGDTSTRKILHNGHLYILRDGKVYNGHGQIVK